jgi:hypothetical protein
VNQKIKDIIERKIREDNLLRNQYTPLGDNNSSEFRNLVHDVDSLKTKTNYETKRNSLRDGRSEVFSYEVKDVRIQNKRQAYVWMENNDRSYGEKDGVDSYVMPQSEVLIKGITPSTTKSLPEFQNNFLLEKTRRFFNEGKIKTMVSSFYNREPGSEIQTAITSDFGVPKGRNLLSVKPHVFGDIYENPYCRAWTWANQYRTLKETIRPFFDGDGENAQPMTLEKLHQQLPQIRPGLENFVRFTSLMDNGFPKIAPYKSDFNNEMSKSGTTWQGNSFDRYKFNRNYFFSIENLAWKDLELENILCPSQIGPNGGRIYWFSPLNLDFDESISVNLNKESFIGRGEQVITYIDTIRTGNLSFVLLVDHSSFHEFMEYRKAAGGENMTDEDYQNILKWDAGCIDPASMKFRQPYGGGKLTRTIIKIPDPIPEKEPPEEPVIPKIKTDPITIVKVYFPNDYSGIDDGSEMAMQYLYKGLGQYYGQEGLNGYEMGGGRTLSNVVFDGTIFSTNTDTVYLQTNGCETTNEFVKTQLFTNYQGNITRTDSLSHYTNANTTNTDLKSKKGFLPRTKYKNSISYYDVTQSSLNISKPEENPNGYSFQEFYEKLGDPEITKIFNDAVIVNIIGCASPQGYADDNNKLARNRAEILRDFIGENFGLDTTDQEKWIVKTENKGSGASGCSSGEDYKKSRYAYVTVINEIDDPNSVPITEADIQGSEEGNTEIENINSGEGQSNRAEDAEMGITEVSVSMKNRYDEEMDFYNYINKNTDLTFSKIKDRYNHYIPALWSLTPEGYNGRLTFLQQCTRQGPTQAASDERGNANNLSFGRPPVCILKIGDFVQTRIYIENLSIDYKNQSNIQWDLNPEGIGIQPMMATVRMSFIYMGGQDLSGPISQLQNAVTFNYYANTSVYDDRSSYMPNGITDYNQTSLFNVYDYAKPIKPGDMEKDLNKQKFLKYLNSPDIDPNFDNGVQDTQGIGDVVQNGDQIDNAARGVNPKLTERLSDPTLPPPSPMEIEQINESYYDEENVGERRVNFMPLPTPPLKLNTPQYTKERILQDAKDTMKGFKPYKPSVPLSDDRELMNQATPKPQSMDPFENFNNNETYMA